MNDCGKAVAAKKIAKEADGETSDIPKEIFDAAEDGSLTPEQISALCVLQIKELSKSLSGRVAPAQKSADAACEKRDGLMATIGNILHETVPVHNDEDVGNRVERTWGNCAIRKKLNHVEVMEKLGCMDTSARVTAMSGGRAYVLRGGLVQLHLALVSYAMSFLVQRGYMPFYPPFFMDRAAMSDVAELAQYDDELYKVTGEGSDKYLIATSEQPLTAYHKNKWYTELPQPIKYAGWSSCFRKEAGSHGKDTLGIFRVHQFDKVEQFLVTSPRDGASWKALDEMISTSEDFYKSLNLPYRVVSICSAALNNAAAKKFDLEGWFPASGTFRELVSCSNTTDYLSRKINCRFGQNLRGTAAVNIKEHAHLLNGTLCAITRTLCAIAEHYQTDEGIDIPEALQPFMLGTKQLKYEDAKKYIDPCVAEPTAPAQKPKPEAKK